MGSTKKHKHILVVLLLVLGAATILMQTHIVSAQAVSQGYASDNALQIGMIVEFDPKNSSKIVPATQATADKVQGVVVAPNDATVSLSTNNGLQQFYVATSGNYKVLVSDQNGTIHAGDYLVISSLAGVGMDADTTQRIVLGKATQDFTGKGDGVLGTTTLKDQSGASRVVHLGYVVAAIAVAANPQLQQTTTAGLPGFLKRAGESVSGKQVSYGRIYLSLGVLIVSAIIAGSVLYAGVKSGMVAIGRNPLARKFIMRNLLQVIFTSLIVFIIGIFAVYLLLKL